MARAAVSRGYGLVFVDARDAIEVPSYEGVGGAASLVARVACASLRRGAGPASAVGWAVLLAALELLPPALVLASPGAAQALCLAVQAAVYLYAWRANRHPPLGAPLALLAPLVAAYVLARGALEAALRGSVEWRGRVYGCRSISA